MVLESPSILISDDDAEYRDTLRAVFEPQGYRTILAGDGQEALDVLAYEEVHLALLDLHMPRLSGLDVLRMLAESHAASQALLPCILMSAALDEAVRQQAERLAYSVLDKPVSRQTLCGTVESAMRWAYNWPDDASVE